MILLDLTAVDDTLRNYVTDYRLHVINLADLDETHFRTGLHDLIGLAKCRYDRKLLQQYCQDNAERLSHLDDNTYDVICNVLNLKHLSQHKKKYRMQKGEDLNMCQAMEDWLSAERSAGRQEGLITGRQEGELAGENKLGQLISRLLERGRTTDAAAAASDIKFRKRLYQEFDM